MKGFEKIYGKGRFTKSDLEYIHSRKEKDENSLQDELDSMEKNIDELNKTEAKENNEKFEKNSGEILKDLSIFNFDSNNNRDTKIFNIKKDNKKLNSKSKQVTSQTSGKRKGRKKKEKAGTGKHSANVKDNQRDKEVRKLISFILTIINIFLKENNLGHLKRINVKLQFGSNYEDNLKFFHKSFLEIFCYIANDKKKEKTYKDFKNKKLIKDLMDKKNEFFYTLMNYTLVDCEEITNLIRTSLLPKIKEKEKIKEDLYKFEDKTKILLNHIINKVNEKKEKKIQTLNLFII